MRKILLALLLFVASAAFGGDKQTMSATSPDGKISVTLTLEACVGVVADLLAASGATQELLLEIRAGSVRMDDVMHEACWVVRGDEVRIAMEEGLMTAPMSEFSRDSNL